MDEESLQQNLWHAIAQLPLPQREALLLATDKELTLAEIAVIVEADTEIVAWRLAQAQKKLRLMLEPHLGTKP